MTASGDILLFPQGDNAVVEIDLIASRPMTVPLARCVRSPTTAIEMAVEGTRTPARCGVRVAHGIDASGDGDDDELHRSRGLT